MSDDILEYYTEKEKSQVQIERAKKILKSHDIEMDIWGCGCCDTPVVKFTYKGEVIFDLDNVELKMDG
jgi:hypothetical protein